MARVKALPCAICGGSTRDGPIHLSTEKHRAAAYRRSLIGAGIPEAPRFRYTEEAVNAHYEELARAAGWIMPDILESFDPVEIGDPEPAAPAAMRDHRPEPCERCGQSFRTEKGAAWHRANNPRCTRWAPARARLARAS